MAIKKFYSTKNKAGWKFDSKREKFWSWGFDIYLSNLIMHSGADFETVASITGQSRHTLWHYTHANENSINAAVSVLEDFANNSLDDSVWTQKKNANS